MTAQRSGRLLDFASRYGYWLLWGAVALIYTWRVAGHTLGRDIFEHAASIRELATHPGAPLHPILAIDEPHSLFSPYSWVLGLGQGALDADAVAVLASVGYLNLLVLAFGLRAFVREFSPSPLAPTLTLAFALVLWGILPPAWSGMLHLQSISYGLPYPSAFVLGLALFALVQVRRYLVGGGWLRLAGILGATVFSVLSHPYTSVLLYVGAAAFVIEAVGRARLRRVVTVLGAGLLGAALAIPWPFFPLVDLIAFQEDAFATDHRAMYTSAAAWTFLAWPGIVALGLRARVNLRDPLAVMFALALVGYAAGWVIGAYNVGRLLPTLMLILHVGLAVMVAEWLAAPVPDRLVKTRAVARWAGVAGLVILAALGVARVALATNESYEGISAVSRAIPQYDVVMADLETSGRVPVWGGKVVGWDGSLPFVEDRDRREAETRTFFSDGVSQVERQAILDRWGATWIMFDRGSLDLERESVDAILELGTVVESDGSLVLLRTSER